MSGCLIKKNCEAKYMKCFDNCNCSYKEQEPREGCFIHGPVLLHRHNAENFLPRSTLSGCSDFFKENMKIFSYCLLCTYFLQNNPFWSLRIHRSATHTTKKEKLHISQKSPGFSVFKAASASTHSKKMCFPFYQIRTFLSLFHGKKKGFNVCSCVSLFVQLSMSCPKQASNAPSMHL